MEGMWRILQRNKDENEIKRMRSYLQNIVDSMPSVLVAVNLDGIVTHWNLEAAHLTGLTEEQTKGRSRRCAPAIERPARPCSQCHPGGKAVENERFTVRDRKSAAVFRPAGIPLIANGAQGAVVGSMMSPAAFRLKT